MKRKPAAQFRRELDAKLKRKTAGRPWSNAKPTDCPHGHRHASGLEAKVCARLTLETRARGQTLYHQVRMPLFAMAPDERGRASFLTVDFVLVEAGRMVRAIDAKPKRRKSRDWRRGALAFAATYGIRIEEVER